MHNFIKTIMCTVAMIVGLTANSLAAHYNLTSPDGRMQMEIYTEPRLYYTVSMDGNEVIAPSPIGMVMNDGRMWNGTSTITNVAQSSHNDVVYPLMGKNKVVPDYYNELILSFDDEYDVHFRVYNEGAAYRFVGTGAATDSLVVAHEVATFDIKDNPAVVLPDTTTYTSWEVTHSIYDRLSDMSDGEWGLTPMLFDNRRHDYKVVIAESDLHNYPGMYLKKTQGVMCGHWAQYPRSIEMGSWGNFITVVKERENFLARTSAQHAFPWRIMMVSDDDRRLLTNEMIYLLAKPQQITDTDWIRPGKATWEWWHCAILENAPFKSRTLTTELYKYYIDFASENGIEYLLVDAGWSNVFDHLDFNKNIDIKEVIQYGKEKEVGVWLWTVAATLFHNKHIYLDSISAWGAVGVKIDFFDRDDAGIIPEYEELAKACAERHLMVDFHGCSKPTGLHRAYPNIMTYEAMRGAECAKWDTSSDPVYRIQNAFTRMLCGGTDYTPGSMRNATREVFRPIDHNLPMTLGTRCHDMALYLIIDSPFSMLADSPDEYRKYPDILRYLSQVPTTWDKTIPLLARFDDYVVMARQLGDTWYVGGINDWDARQVVVDFSFLPDGEVYEVEIFRDTNKSNIDANCYHREVKRVKSKETMKIDMAQGGGFVMILTK
ncbi:MAG: glycoside hydrolase family 97 protein [Bacteroidaceae bacterium]|nr:glycoside hydrolase family 97 protein [Bacteroidaceae bacterium]